jgi:hypothetical protein
VSDVLTINNVAINLTQYNATLDRCVPLLKGGIPELDFSRLLGPLTALPDPWSGQPVSWSNGGTTYFVGDVQGYVDRFMGDVGWVREYRALGLRNRADYIPVTDAVTFSDTSLFNLPGTDPNFVGARAGLTVGQIVTQELEMLTNATPLNAAGLGAYTSLSPPALPTLTVNDLAALTVIPQGRVSISGERILQAIENFVQQWHPNHWLHIQPDGTIRFLDLRQAASNTLIMDSDPRIDKPTLTRDYSDCFSQVIVRGNTLATPVVVQTQPWPGSSLSDGGLQEDFAWGTYTNAQAKANWTPASYNQPVLGGTAQDQGTCTCPDTMHVQVTSSNAATTWSANYWGQASNEAQGIVTVTDDLLAGSISQIYAAKIVANTALSAGGTSTLTLDRALPAITYNSYQIWGTASGESLVYRKYKVTNAAIGSAMLNAFPYPWPILGVPGQVGASVTSTPQGFYQYSQSGTGAPYNLGTDQISVDPVTGHVWYARPTAVAAGTTVVTPYNVIAFLAIGTGALEAIAPSSGYAGTLFTVEGIQRIKIITVRDWTDLSNSANMQTFASEFLDSVSNVVVEGSLPYNGFLPQFLLCGASGQGVNIAGNGYTTGWESLNLPVVGVQVLFQNGPQGASYKTTLQLSNRRGRYTSANFLRPGISSSAFGLSTDNAFTGGTAGFAAGTANPNPTGYSPAISAAQAQAYTGAGQAQGWNASPISTNASDYYTG